MSPPAFTRRTIRLPASEIREGGRVLSCTLEHLREAEGAIVCAEGDEYAFTPDYGATDVFGVGGHLAAYLPDLNEVHYINETVKRPVPSGVTKMRYARAADGTEYVYVFTDAIVHAHKLTGEETSVYCGLLSYVTVTAYHERLYVPDGRKVKFSKLLDFSAEGWQAEESEQGMSSFYLHSPGGDITDALVAHGKLVLLREEGITLLTGYADVYNFRLTDVVYTCGRMIAGTGAVCCGDVYFFTEKGLCVFDGNKTARAEGASDSTVDLTQPIRISVRGDTLFASVTRTDGEQAIYAYEPVLRRGRFLFNPYECITAGEGAYLLRGTQLYALSGRAVPAGKRCKLSLELALSDLIDGEKRLEAVVIEGTGAVRVSAAGADGVPIACDGVAGERISIPSAVRGETVSVVISSEDASLCMHAVTFCVRKEDRV